MSMLDWYVALVRSKATELLSLTDILFADAFFSKYEFVNDAIGMGFRFVGRLRANSYLRYLAIPDPSAPRRRGRKKKYGEKVDFSSLDMSVFTSFIYEDSKGIKTRCHTAVVHSRALKRDIRIVVCPVENGEHLLYFSTDIDMRPEKTAPASRSSSAYAMPNSLPASSRNRHAIKTDSTLHSIFPLRPSMSARRS